MRHPTAIQQGARTIRRRRYIIILLSFSDRIVFDDEASAPKPYSKTLVSVAPHGILTLGWSFVISSRAFFDTETKWLVAPAMMVLPFVSDIMR